MRMSLREKMRADWDRRASLDPFFWAAPTDAADHTSYEATADRDARALARGLEHVLVPNARVLDLGCGTGRLTARTAPLVKSILGVDVSPEMIRIAESTHKALPNLRFEVTNGSDLRTLDAEVFELVYSYSVFPHLEPELTEAYFYEANRVLVASGVFRFQLWIGPERRPSQGDTLSVRVYNEEQLRVLCERTGFGLDTIEPIDYFDPVLKLSPSWVTASKIRTVVANQPPNLPESAPGPDELALEYELSLFLAIKNGERNESDEAKRVLDQCIALAPKRPEAYVEQIKHCLHARDFAGALRFARRLTEQAPECLPGWLYRAQFAEATGDLDQTRAALRTLLQQQGLDSELNDAARIIAARVQLE